MEQKKKSLKKYIKINTILIEAVSNDSWSSKATFNTVQFSSMGWTVIETNFVVRRGGEGRGVIQNPPANLFILSMSTLYLAWKSTQHHQLYPLFLHSYYAYSIWAVLWWGKISFLFSTMQGLTVILIDFWKMYTQHGALKNRSIFNKFPEEILSFDAAGKLWPKISNTRR